MKIDHCPHYGQGRCPYYGQSLSESRPISVDALKVWCRENSIPIYAGDRIPAEGAAIVLGITAATLKNRRSLGLGPPHVRTSRGARVTYRLSDLAESFRTKGNDG